MFSHVELDMMIQNNPIELIYGAPLKIELNPKTWKKTQLTSIQVFFLLFWLSSPKHMAKYPMLAMS